MKVFQQQDQHIGYKEEHSKMPKYNTVMGNIQQCETTCTDYELWTIKFHYMYINHRMISLHIGQTAEERKFSWTRKGKTLVNKI